MCKINIWYFSMWIRKKAFPGEIVSNIPRGNINAKCPCLSGTIPDCFAFEGIIRTNVQNDICRNMEIYIYIFSFGHNSDSWSNNFWRMKENFAKSFETCFNDKLVSQLWNLRFAQVPFNLSRAEWISFLSLPSFSTNHISHLGTRSLDPRVSVAAYEYHNRDITRFLIIRRETEQNSRAFVMFQLNLQRICRCIGVTLAQP